MMPLAKYACLILLGLLSLPQQAYSDVGEGCDPAIDDCGLNEMCQEGEDSDECQCSPGYVDIDGDLKCEDPCTGKECFDVNAEFQCQNNAEECLCDDPNLEMSEGKCQDPCTGKDCFEMDVDNKCENNAGTCTCSDADFELIEGTCQDACYGYDCADKDTCEADGGVCKCDDGYYPEETTDVCTKTCSGGSCLTDTTCTVNGATCECNAGYYPPETIDGTCTHPCEDKDCYPERCEDNGSDECVCNENLYWNVDASDCVDACSGKACIDMEPATCTVEGAACECIEGYYPEVTLDGICKHPCHYKDCFDGTCRDNGDNTCVCNGNLVWNVGGTNCIGACDGTTCEGESTCVVDGKDCKCIAGYYPEVTTDGMCTHPCEGKGCFEDTCKDNGGNTCVCNEGLVWNADKTDCVVACSGTTCMEKSTCMPNGVHCECKDGYYPEVTPDGICTHPCQTKDCFEGSCEDTGGNMCVCKDDLAYNVDATDCIDPCLGKPCYEASPATCEKVAGRCMCIGTLTLDGEGNCVDVCHGRPCAEAPAPYQCKDMEGGCSCIPPKVFDKDDRNCQDACTGKPCYNEAIPTCENEGTDCRCIGHLEFDAAGNCVDACEYKPCKEAAVPRQCRDANEGVCRCRLPYRLTNTGFCVDDCVGKPCYAAGTCRFNEVTLDCRCIGGFELNGIFECVDEDDECRTGVAECRTNFICQDVPGSYECVCDREGYELRGDECIETSNRQTYIIIGVVSGLVLITLFVGICTCVACRRGPAVQRLVAYPPAPPIIYPGPRIRPLRALRFNAATPRLQFA